MFKVFFKVFEGRVQLLHLSSYLISFDNSLMKWENIVWKQLKKVADERRKNGAKNKEDKAPASDVFKFFILNITYFLHILCVALVWTLCPNIIFYSMFSVNFRTVANWGIILINIIFSHWLIKATLNECRKQLDNYFGSGLVLLWFEIGSVV